MSNYFFTKLFPVDHLWGCGTSSQVDEGPDGSNIRFNDVESNHEFNLMAGGFKQRSKESNSLLILSNFLRKHNGSSRKLIPKTFTTAPAVLNVNDPAKDELNSDLQ